jgi:hypothetical protein
LPRRPAKVFDGRDEALGVLERALGARGGAVVTQAVYGLGRVGTSELALQDAAARRGDYGPGVEIATRAGSRAPPRCGARSVCHLRPDC